MSNCFTKLHSLQSDRLCCINLNETDCLFCFFLKPFASANVDFLFSSSQENRGIPWVNTDVLKKVGLHRNETWFEEEILTLHLLLFSPPHVCPSYPHTLILHLFFDLMWIKFFWEAIPICQNKMELYLTLPLTYDGVLSLSIGGRCTVVRTSCVFCLTPWKVLNIKNNCSFSPLWTVLSGWCMKCWCGRRGLSCQLNHRPAGWPWDFPSPSFSFFIWQKRKKQSKLNSKIRIHPPFCADTQSIAETSAAWGTAVLMQPRWCWPPVWKW